jgi:hypothetical protein
MTLISVVSLASRRISRQASPLAASRPLRVVRRRVHVSSSQALFSHGPCRGSRRASFATAVPQKADDGADTEPPRRRAVVHLDFFGEPVTFLEAVSSSRSEAKSVSAALAAADGHLLTVASRGVSCTGGGREAGLA